MFIYVIQYIYREREIYIYIYIYTQTRRQDKQYSCLIARCAAGGHGQAERSQRELHQGAQLIYIYIHILLLLVI